MTPATAPAAELHPKLTDAEQRRLDRLAEKETILRFDEAAPILHVYTSHPRVASHLIRRGAKPLRVDHRGQKTPAAWTFEVPRKWFKSPSPPRPTTEAQREASRKAARRAHLARGGYQDRAPASGIPPVDG